MQLLIVMCVALARSTVAEDRKIGEISAETDSDAAVTTLESIVKYGYVLEIHNVITEDGYVLTMHRISGGPASFAAEGKPVIFLMHGFVFSSTDWVVMGPEKGFGYILADAGYDVWMGNARGNMYSKNHTTITDLTSEEFWHFDWHEIGVYDLPAMIEFILKFTNNEKLIYIGHSQGTTSFYVMAALRPEYNDKIKAMFSLAPVAYVEHLRSPLLRFAANFINSLELFSELFGIHEFLPSSKLLTATGEIYCNDEALTQGLCSNLLFLLFGYDQAQLNTTALPKILRQFPSGASTRQILHYGQEVRSKEFRWYDHGLLQNFLTYRSFSPSNYDLSAVTAPVYLLYSENDYLAAPEDVQRLYSELGNPIELYRVSDEKWNHVDFVWGNNAKEYVYDYILTILKRSYLS